MRSTAGSVGISLLPAQAVATAKGGEDVNRCTGAREILNKRRTKIINDVFYLAWFQRGAGLVRGVFRVWCTQGIFMAKVVP